MRLGSLISVVLLMSCRPLLHGRVVLPSGQPAVGATVHLLEDSEVGHCPVCDRGAFLCPDPTALIERANRTSAPMKQPHEKRTTDTGGAFTFTTQPPDGGVVVATLGAQFGVSQLGAPLVVHLLEQASYSIEVVDEDRAMAPLADAKVELRFIASGERAEAKTDATGHATFTLNREPKLVIVTAPDKSPTTTFLWVDQTEARLALATPRAGTIRVQRAGKPVDATLTFRPLRWDDTFPGSHSFEVSTQQGSASLPKLPTRLNQLNVRTAEGRSYELLEVMFSRPNVTLVVNLPVGDKHLAQRTTCTDEVCELNEEP